MSNTTSNAQHRVPTVLAAALVLLAGCGHKSPTAPSQPEPPAAPSGLKVTSPTWKSLKVSWAAASGATSYDLYRDTAKGGLFKIVAYTGPDTLFTDSTLQSSTTYYYEVRASNAAGQSPPSATANGTTNALSAVPTFVLDSIYPDSGLAPLPDTVKIQCAASYAGASVPITSYSLILNGDTVAIQAAPIDTVITLQQPGTYQIGSSCTSARGGTTSRQSSIDVQAPPLIAFWSFMEIYVGELNDSIVDVRRLTNDGVQDMDPAWSPDGKHLIWVANRADSTGWFAIYETDDFTDENTEKRLTPQISNFDITAPVWCANGEIYFNYWDHTLGTQGIGRIKPDGTGLQKVNEESGAATGNQLSGAPTCSPDGSKIAYVWFPNGTADIYVANADGSDPQDITNSSLPDWSPAWSPSGNTIAFISIMGRSGIYPYADIFTINTDGTGLKQITSDDNGTYTEVDPTFSPDGKSIIFAFDSASFYHPKLAVVSANGGAWKEVLSQDSEEPAWRPPSN